MFNLTYEETELVGKLIRMAVSEFYSGIREDNSEWTEVALLRKKLQDAGFAVPLEFAGTESEFAELVERAPR